MKFFYKLICIIRMNTLQKLTDEQLVQVVCQKDQEMYVEIIRRYDFKLRNYLRRFVGNNDELEDVLQETFIKTFRNLNDFDTKRKFSSWIYRITHNEAINHLKRKSFLSLDEHDYELLDTKVDFQRDIDQKLLTQSLTTSLSKLKEKYRSPLILFYLEEKSYEEISDILQLPKNTVGTLIKRGKEQLKKIINRTEYGKK